MAIRARIESFDRDIRALIDEELSPEAMSRHLAAVARREIADAEQINTRALGRTPPHRTYVDGREGAALESVSPRGVIVAEFDLVEDMLQWIGTALVEASPILTGAYRDSHLILADGAPMNAVQTGGAFVMPPLPSLWSEIVFVSTVPYARKIERGLSAQAPDGVYQGVAAMAARRFGNTARVRFSYRSLLPAAMKTGRAGKQAERDSRQPAIVITPHG